MSQIVLDRVGSGSLTTTQDDDHALYRGYRLIFDASRCARRKVYWIEKIFGRSVLRQVTHLDRRTKAEDRVLVTAKGSMDFDLVRLVIAGTSAEEILTGVRWEVYSDFACTDRVAMGRFDHFDLLPPPNKVAQIATQHAVGYSGDPKAWDFDGLLIAHRCPVCGNTGDKCFIIFSPKYLGCAHCAREKRRQAKMNETVAISRYDPAQSQPTAPGNEALVRTYLQRLTRTSVGIFSTVDAAALPIMYAIELNATALLCWFVVYGTEYHPALSMRYPWVGLEELRTCYERSVFPLLTIEEVSGAIVDCRRRIYDEEVARIHRLDESSFIPQGIDLETWRTYRLEQAQEEFDKFRRRLAQVTRLGDWLFTRPNDKGDAEQAAFRDMRAALDEFPFDVDLIAEYVGRCLLEGRIL